MELLKLDKNPKLYKETNKKQEFESKNYKIHLFSTADPKVNMKFLLNVKLLFQKMLPKMPKEYILRQVIDPKQCNCVLTNENSSEILGAVCFRPAYERNLVEIIYFAVSSSKHISGYGSFLMNIFKESIKMQYIEFCKEGISFLKKSKIFDNLNVFDTIYENKEDYKRLKTGDKEYTEKTNIYIVTYADNSAIGFFKKQGFSLNPISTVWIKYVKDYDGGTLMECKLHKELNYLKQKDLILSLNAEIMQRMKKYNDYHVIKNNETEISQDISDNFDEMTPQKVLKNFIAHILSQLYANPSSWPFLEPVDPKDVPEYPVIVKEPMDLSTIKKKYEYGEYKNLSSLKHDVELMINNCYTFNSHETQYYKCAENLEKCFQLLLEKHNNTIKRHLLDESLVNY